VLTPIIKVLRTTKYFDNIAHMLGRGLKLFGDLVYKVSYEDICCGAIQLNEEGHDQQLATPPLLSTLQQFTDEKTWRFVQGLLFLANTWLVQLRVNAARSIVLLSVVRDLPLLDANHSETFAKIREKQIPVLIFWGEHDTILPSHLLESYQKCLPHAKLLCLPGDHGVFLSRPYQVFEFMKNFIQNSEVY
jgi:pimeloyl-ACP methyl ester carboxylesterase